MKRVLGCIGVLLLCASFIQCSGQEGRSSQPTAEELAAAKKELVDAVNGFGLALFKEVAKERGDENTLISPLSAAMALAMTYNGADGSTRRSMEKALQLAGLDAEKVNRSYLSLMESLSKLDPEVRFEIANSIWYRKGEDFEKEFLKLCDRYFHALVTELDFGNPKAPQIINRWVSQKTEERIQEIVGSPIERETVMFLINAIYFKGAWMYQFDSARTKKEWFLLPDGGRKLCPMMEQKAEFEHLVTDDFHAARLPYGDGRFSMTIIVPHPGKDVDSFIRRLTEDRWAAWLDEFSRDSLNVFIPRFTLQSGDTLNAALTSLGMGQAFSQNADFTKMTSEGGIWIDAVIHKTFLHVDEEGTEAAAATSVKMSKGPPLHQKVLRADRPFVFVIREDESQTLLLIGKVTDPSPHEE